MSTDRESVARELHAISGYDTFGEEVPWERLHDSDKYDYLVDADRIIEALRSGGEEGDFLWYQIMHRVRGSAEEWHPWVWSDPTPGGRFRDRTELEEGLQRWKEIYQERSNQDWEYHIAEVRRFARPSTETEAPGEGETHEAWECMSQCPDHRRHDYNPDEGSGEGEALRWTDEDDAELRDCQARVSCSGRYDQYEPTRQDHSRLAELKERKDRATKAWVRRVEEYQSLSDSALEQVARYRAEQGGVNPDTAALLVLLCERWSRLRSRPEPTVEGEDAEWLETWIEEMQETRAIDIDEANRLHRILACLRERPGGEREYQRPNPEHDTSSGWLPPERLVLEEIRAERRRQDEKWGTSFPDRDWDRWVTILLEEVGEFAEAVLEMPYRDDGEEAIRKELIQVAAVAVSALTFGAPQGSQRGAGGDGIHQTTEEGEDA